MDDEIKPTKKRIRRRDQRKQFTKGLHALQRSIAKQKKHQEFRLPNSVYQRGKMT